MGSSALSEIGTLISNHPYVSCSLLVFLTPPFFPILKFFSPLLISTALFFLALVTMGPHFEDQSDQEGDLQRSLEDKTGHESILGTRTESGERDIKRKTPSKDFRSTIADWAKSCKDSGLTWVEEKLRNENWRGASLNDDNVSILQEAFAHRAEEQPRAMVKLATRRIPAEEERVAEQHSLQRQVIHEIPNLDSRRSSRSVSDGGFERPPSFTTRTAARELPHDFFSPHPSFSRRPDSDVLFKNGISTPTEHDMPPLVNGPAEVTAPLYDSFEDDMDTSDDEYGHYHARHDEDMHLEVGERSSDPEHISREELPAANATRDHLLPFTVIEEDLPSSSDSDEELILFTGFYHRNGAMEPPVPIIHDVVHDRDMNLHDQQTAHVTGTHAEIAPHDDDDAEEHAPPAELEALPVPAPNTHHEDHPLPAAAHEKTSLPSGDVELHDIPELEDILPVEGNSRELPPTVAESTESIPRDLHVADKGVGEFPAGHNEPDISNVPKDHVTISEEFYAKSEAHVLNADASVEPPHFVERSLSLPVMGSLADTGSIESAPAHEDLPPLDEPLPDKFQEPANSSVALNHAISLPAAMKPIHPIVIPPKTLDEGPRSPDTDLGYATTPDHERRGLARRGFFAPERYNSITSASGDELEHGPPVKQLSTKEKIEQKLEALCNSIPRDSTSRSADISLLRATTDEQVIHVADKMKSFVEDSPSRKFQPDAPQLKITPPSTKVPLNASLSKSAILISALGRPSIRTSRYASAGESSESSDGDEQIDLDSDVGSETDSDVEITGYGKPGTRLKAPPRLSPKPSPKPRAA